MTAYQTVVQKDLNGSDFLWKKVCKFLSFKKVTRTYFGYFSHWSWIRSAVGYLREGMSRSLFRNVSTNVSTNMSRSMAGIVIINGFRSDIVWIARNSTERNFVIFVFVILIGIRVTFVMTLPWLMRWSGELMWSPILDLYRSHRKHHEKTRKISTQRIKKIRSEHIKTCFI